MKSSIGMKLLAACGTCVSVAAVATAQPSVVNISGATLLENYVRAPASTNDYLDLDGDGIAGRFNSASIDQLAPALTGGTFGPNLHLIVQYRSTGSINGFVELMNHGCGSPATGDHTGTPPTGIRGATPGVTGGFAAAAYANRSQYILTNASTGIYNAGNPGGAPYTSNALFQGLWAAAPNSSGGIFNVDLSPMDVPTAWAVQTTGTPFFNATPGQPGYGALARFSTNADGTGSLLSSSLPTLQNNRNLYTGNPAQANTNTIFDTPFSFAVITPVVNPGTGLSQLTMTQMQYIFGTGRAQNGENLHAITRDVGSGTRNAFMNCIGMDPAWGVGDNVGPLANVAADHSLGAAYKPTNKNSNGNLELTVRNQRLGVGYAGGERGVTGSGSGSWLTGSNPALQIPDVKNDLYGGATWVRPTIDEIVHNDAEGWVIGGPAIIASIGDPAAEPVALGGMGRTTPRMCNTKAAAYINNISRSIENFVSVPSDASNVGMPGEYAATQFTLPGAMDRIHNFFTPTQMDANPAFNASLQSYTLANSVYTDSRFAAYNASARGKVPVRNAVTTYSDGVVGGANYITQGGVPVSYGGDLSLRNLIAGDFNGDGLRNLNDVPGMVAAWRQRNGGPTWTAPNGTGPIAGAPGTDAIIEVLGDFNGDGNFNSGDLRYFADGLAVKTATGNIDRRDGFTAIDNAFGGNFFSTTLATGKPYAAGDSRGDIAGAPGISPDTRGWAPVGANGSINGADIDYVYRQFRQNPYILDGAANWSVVAEAVSFDLSADMNGDLVVDQADVVELVTVILGTTMTDVNLDGQCDQADYDVAASFLGQTGGWAKGDLDGDGTITQADLNLIAACLCPGNACGDQDFNGDGDFGTDADIEAFFACLGGDCCTTCFCQGSDFNGDGDFGTDADIESFFRVLGGGAC